jgi:hypothetical protein
MANGGSGEIGWVEELLLHVTDHAVRRSRTKLAQAGKGVGNGLQEGVTAIPSDRPAST